MRIQTGLLILLSALLIAGCGGGDEASGGGGELDFITANNAAKSLGNTYSMDIDFTMGSAAEGFNTRGTIADSDKNTVTFCVAATGGANTPPECASLPAKTACANVTVSTDVVIPPGAEAEAEWVAKQKIASELNAAVAAAAPGTVCQPA
jgi:hypothetical protein